MRAELLRTHGELQAVAKKLSEALNLGSDPTTFSTHLENQLIISEADMAETDTTQQKPITLE